MTPLLVAHSVPVSADRNPLDLLGAASVHDTPRAYWSAYDDDVEVAGAGCAHLATAAGPDRFRVIARAIAAVREGLVEHGAVPPEAPSDPLSDAPSAVPSGVRWIGGFAFEASTPSHFWTSFGVARFVLPAVVVVRRGGRAQLTAIGPARDGAAVAARAARLAGAWGMPGAAGRSEAPQVQNDPIVFEPGDLDPFTAQPDVSRGPGPSNPPPIPDPDFDGFFEPGPSSETARRNALMARLESGIAAVRRGDVEKVVLGASACRSLIIAYDATRVAAHLAKGAPGCTRFVVAPEAQSALVGATPERLVAVEGERVRTMALAGTAPRSSEPDQDAALGDALLASAKNRVEHDHVVQAVRSVLEAAGVVLEPHAEPHLRRLATMQHLETPIAGHLAPRADVLDLAARLHPTPALGGHPREAALALIARLEPEPRGWFGGAVGWLDGRGDGDLAVVIRSLLVHGNLAFAFAGAGLVADSDPADEAQEVDLKLRTAFAPIRELMSGPL